MTLDSAAAVVYNKCQSDILKAMKEKRRGGIAPESRRGCEPVRKLRV